VASVTATRAGSILLAVAGRRGRPRRECIGRRDPERREEQHRRNGQAGDVGDPGFRMMAHR